MNNNTNSSLPRRSDILIAFIPIISLIGAITLVLTLVGVDSVSIYGPVTLIFATVVGIVVGYLHRRVGFKQIVGGVRQSASQMLPAIPILLCIGLISTTWMLSGVVPVMIDYGLILLHPDWFLPVACFICAVISVLLGSSWTTIATVGVALMSIGSVLGYNEGWIAGAIISGAYFGDKVSPLSDTTVIASSTCGVNLFTHIRNLMFTSMPAMLTALAIFTIAGLCHVPNAMSHAHEITQGLQQVFNLSPWLLVIPLITILLCVNRVNSLTVLLISGAMGFIAIFLAQPKVAAIIMGDAPIAGSLSMLLSETQIPTGSEALDSLIATGGMAGMLPTVILITAAMLFGGVLIGTGMLSDITSAMTSRLRARRTMVAATTGTGLMLNSFTGDQYLSIIIGGNIYNEAYRRSGLEPKLLSRTLEDSVSVTSVLIPWNSCGITQSTVLGVATLTYMPFCFFNWLSPLYTVALALIVSRNRSTSQSGRASGWRRLLPVYANRRRQTPSAGQLCG